MTDLPFYHVYHELASRLISEGKDVEVRGQQTKELLGVTFTCHPFWPIADRPQFNERFSLMETLQVITGRGDLAHLRSIAPNFPKLAPSYVTYGPRLAWQLKAVVERLSADPLSRQAQIAVYTPEDFWKGYPDCPCTSTIQFLLRDNQLHCISTMRSNDIWFGTPTDVYMFAFFQREIARALSVEVGDYIHHAGSLHVYERHFDLLEQVGDQPTDKRGPRSLVWGEDLGDPRAVWNRTCSISSQCLDQDSGWTSESPEDMTWLRWLIPTEK